VGEEVAERRDLARPPSPPLILASTSPQRRAILEQLRIPFDVVRPDYEEEPGVDPVEHARAKVRSVTRVVGDRPVLGVDTEVLCDGRLFGKPRDEEDAAEMLNALSGRTHEVVSGLCLLTPAWEESGREVTRVSFRTLTPRDVAMYVAADEWRGRAGAYAVQGFGASLVERIEGDYLNIVGLPASLLVRLLAERFSGTYGFG
jgi:septum formation protein